MGLFSRNNKDVNIGRVVEALRKHKANGSKFDAIWNKFLGRNPQPHHAFQVMLQLFPDCCGEDDAETEYFNSLKTVDKISAEVRRLRDEYGNAATHDKTHRMATPFYDDPYPSKQMEGVIRGKINDILRS